jgi:hypothetical protein
MIGLHGTQREADILAGLLSLLNSPEQYKDKIAGLTAATEQHRATREAAQKAKQEADQAALNVEQRLALAKATEAALMEQKAALDAAASKISLDGKQLQKAKEEHATAIFVHQSHVAAHERQVQQLASQQNQHSAQMVLLQSREEAVRLAEAQHADRARKLREIIG